MNATTRMAAVGLAFLLFATTSTQAQERTRRGLFARWANRGAEQVALRTPETIPHTHAVAPAPAPVVYEYQATYIAPMAAEAAPVESVTPEPATPEPATPALATPIAADPYGFASILNDHRARVGLPPVAVDVNLAAWASQNNAAQCHSGLGHHVNPNCLQNSGWNYSSAWDVFVGWLNSPGHRANMLSPTISRMGIAYGPGPYWTMNAQ